MIKWLPWFLLGLVALGAIFSMVLLLNAGAALDNSRSETKRLADRSDLAMVILRRDWRGKDESRVIALGNELSADGVIVKRVESGHQLGDIVFEIERGKVRDVQYID